MEKNSQVRAASATGAGPSVKGTVPAPPQKARSVAAQDGKQEDSESSSEEESDSEEEMQRAGTSAQVSPLPVRFISPAQRRKPLPFPHLHSLDRVTLSISVSHCRHSPLGKPSRSDLPQVPPRGPLRRPGLQPPRSKSKGPKKTRRAVRRNQTVRTKRL